LLTPCTQNSDKSAFLRPRFDDSLIVACTAYRLRRGIQDKDQELLEEIVEAMKDYFCCDPMSTRPPSMKGFYKFFATSVSSRSLTWEAMVLTATAPRP
jgi:hypothetical protein